MIVVSDTTPVNYLILLDQIHLLHELYDRIVAPQAVYDETQREGTHVTAQRERRHVVMVGRCRLTCLATTVGGMRFRSHF
jgi:predicted nucleic acid-binding protein